MKSRRVERASEAVREVVSTTILFGLRDPRIQGVTVLAAEVAKDLRTAKVFVSVMGDAKQQSLTMQDLAKIGKVTIKGGTGTLVTPDAKVQNLTQLAQFNLITIQEAQDAARPAYSRKLGLPPDPHEQRIETAAHVARNEAKDDANRHRQDHRGQSDEERYP